MNLPHIKICGLRSVEHALVAAEAGADFLGFVFVEGVRRQLQTERARELVSHYRRQFDSGGPGLVGLFRDQPLEWVNEVVRRVGLDFAQLCGEETDHYAAGLVVPAIKQVHVRQDTTQDGLAGTVRSALETYRMVVLDRFDPSTPGGAGKTFDWSVARGTVALKGVLLAGGLNPDNVAEAVETLHPWGVDVSSGVEADGVKDAAKIHAFIAAVRG